MANEPFMLVSLKGDKAKKLAQVMGNPTCTKILEHLAGKDATETKIAEDLNVPLSTVHYNLQQLVAAKLVVVDEFHYSEKGREVNHYKLARKYIIIAPDDDDPTFLERLKKFVPITLITFGAAVIIKTMQFFTGSLSSGASATELSSKMFVADGAPMAKAAIMPVAEQAADAVSGGASPRLMAAVAPSMNEGVNQTLNQSMTQSLNDTAYQAAAQSGQSVDIASNAAANNFVYTQHSLPWWQSPTIDYFIAGAFFVLIVLVIVEMINHLRAKRTKR